MSYQHAPNIPDYDTLDFDPFDDGDFCDLSEMPPGEYFFTVEHAEISLKNGVKQIKAALILEGGGKTAKLHEYLSAAPTMRWKLAQFCKAVGRHADCKEKGKVKASDLKGLGGKAFCDRREYNGKSIFGVKKFLPQPEGVNSFTPQPDPVDDIPF